MDLEEETSYAVPEVMRRWLVATFPGRAIYTGTGESGRTVSVLCARWEASIANRLRYSLFDTDSNAAILRTLAALPEDVRAALLTIFTFDYGDCYPVMIEFTCFWEQALQEGRLEVCGQRFDVHKPE